MAMIKNMAKYQSEGAKVDDDFTSYLADLHVDYDDEELKTQPTLYDIAVSNIVELRDPTGGFLTFSYETMDLLITETLMHLDGVSLLAQLHSMYRKGIKSKEIAPGCSFVHWLCNFYDDVGTRNELSDFITNWSSSCSESHQNQVHEDWEFLQQFLEQHIACFREGIDSPIPFRYNNILYI